MKTHFSGFFITSRFWILAIVLLPLTTLSVSKIHADQVRSPKGLAVDWRRHVETSLLQSLETQDKVEFIIFLEQQADLNLANQFHDKETKARFAFETLQDVALTSQVPIINLLKARGAQFQSYWIVNMIWVKGDFDLIQSLARRSDISYIFSNPSLKMNLPDRNEFPRQASSTNLTYQWNLELIEAPEVWQLGYLGQGIVVGGQDTGYEWQHPALKPQYRGWDGDSVDHNYNWHDAIHEGQAACGPDALIACDGHGHGTHTMGIMVGDDGFGTRTGVAPGAKWIGCRNMTDQGVGTPATYAECYQWFVAPTDLSGQNPDPSMAPDVISNSWSCPPSEGCTEPDVLEAVVANVRSAGILTVHSAGNSGPGCGTINRPAAIYDSSFTVGATTSTDVIWTGSSRGPVTIDGSNRLKPDITAPGVGVNSSWLNDSYVSLTGTSMASPHVAGVAALVMSANNSLRGKPADVESLLTETAIPKLAISDCGGISGDSIPNNSYGYGRVDAYNAYLNAVPYHIFFPQAFVSSTLKVQVDRQ